MLQYNYSHYIELGLGIISIFLFRTIFRILLLLWYKSGIQTSPPIIPLDRDAEFGNAGENLSHGCLLRLKEEKKE
jgi:hypothetical protein